MKPTRSHPVTVSRYMTRAPHTIGADQPLAVAHELMRQHHLRHLPVLAHGGLVGILSLGDLHLVETLRDVQPGNTTVEEAMSAEPYVVSPEAPLGEVLRIMETRKLGSTVVVEDRRVVGIFTTHDALRALRALLAETAALPPQRSAPGKH